MKNKSAIIGFAIITLTYILIMFGAYMGTSKATWAYLVGYGVIGYVGILIFYVIVISAIRLFRDVLQRSKLPSEQRLTAGQFIKKHTVTIFLVLIVLWIIFTGLVGEY